MNCGTTSTGATDASNCFTTSLNIKGSAFRVCQFFYVAEWLPRHATLIPSQVSRDRIIPWLRMGELHTRPWAYETHELRLLQPANVSTCPIDCQGQHATGSFSNPLKWMHSKIFWSLPQGLDLDGVSAYGGFGCRTYGLRHRKSMPATVIPDFYKTQKSWAESIKRQPRWILN